MGKLSRLTVEEAHAKILASKKPLAAICSPDGAIKLVNADGADWIKIRSGYAMVGCAGVFDASIDAQDFAEDVTATVAKLNAKTG